MGRDDDSDKKARPPWAQSAKTNDDANGKNRQSDRCRLDRSDVLANGPKLRHKCGGLLGDIKSEQLLDLAGEDNDGDSGSKPDCDRKWNVFDIGAEPEKSDGYHRSSPP